MVPSLVRGPGTRNLKTQPRILWRVFDIMNDQHKFPRALVLQGPAAEKKTEKK